MTKKTCVLAFLTIFTFGVGVMFEFFRWPYRGVIMLVGFLLMNFGLLPFYFIEKFKKL